VRSGAKPQPKIDFMHIWAFLFWGQKEAIWNTFFSIDWFGHGVLVNQIQALSRTFRHRFKDCQGPCLFSRTFQALKIWEKIHGFQGLSRTRKSPGKNKAPYLLPTAGRVMPNTHRQRHRVQSHRSQSAVWTKFATSSRWLPTDSVDNFGNWPDRLSRSE